MQQAEGMLLLDMLIRLAFLLATASLHFMCPHKHGLCSHKVRGNPLKFCQYRFLRSNACDAFEGLAVA